MIHLLPWRLGIASDGSEACPSFPVIKGRASNYSFCFMQREHGQTVALDIATGLGYLHSQGLVHGRLKSTNVLMNKAGVAKLSDVALNKLLSHCKTGTSEKTLRPPPAQEESELRLSEVSFFWGWPPLFRGRPPLLRSGIIGPLP